MKETVSKNTGTSRDIICSHCGFKGKIKAWDTEVQFSSNVLFNPLGKDPEGFLYFKCPSCLREFRIDPFKLLGVAPPSDESVLELPDSDGVKRNRITLLIVAGILAVLGLWFIAFHSGWVSKVLGVVVILIGYYCWGKSNSVGNSRKEHP